MLPLIAAYAGAKLLSGLMGAKAANAQKAAQYANQLNQEAEAWTTNIADNQAIAEADLQNTIRTGYKTGIINMQRGQAKQQAVQSGLQLSRSTELLQGQTSANSYAAGALGPSVDAVVLDIAQRSAEARNQISDDYLLQENNFDTQMHDVLTAGTDAVRSSRKITVNHAAAPSYTGLGEVLANTAIDIVGSYASSKMSLGLGKTTGGSGTITNEVF